MPKSCVDWKLLGRKARELFGVKTLRPGQREIIECVLSGKSALGLMPTGSGKSLCYQLPALFLPKITLVISPLLSLMQDQTLKLNEAGIEAAKIDSTLTQKEERQALLEVKNGHAELVYVTPERLENPAFLEPLCRAGVSLVVVDEAHCVSQWGHDFRPAFLTIKQAIQKLGNPPVLALTATATPEVERDVLTQLGMARARVFSTGVDRPNLNFQVLRTVNEHEKFQRLLEVLVETDGTGIVYVTTVKLANELHRKLLGSGIVAGKYHGKMKMPEREQMQDDFMHDRHKVIVATKAFGLGIDKPNVRFVVHYTFPDSVESYYQEAGRGGRDGKPARAILLYRLEDKRIHSYFLGGKYPTRADAAHLYQSVLKLSGLDRTAMTLDSLIETAQLPKTKARVLIAYLENEGIVSRNKNIRLLHTFDSSDATETFLNHYDERTEADRERIQKIMRYGQMTECRAIYFRNYFGEATGQLCQNCDNCLTHAARSVPLAS